MANLTITVNAEVLRRARIRGIERGESVNAFLARKLAEYAGAPEQEDALDQVAELARRLGGRSAYAWDRQEIHER